MRPKPFIPIRLTDDDRDTSHRRGDRPVAPRDTHDRYVRDETTGLVWHRCGHRVLYADTDRSGVVYHANHLRYFELGRATLMRDAAYPYREIEESGFVYPIIQVGLDYFRPLAYDDAMCIHTRPSDMERVKLRFDYVITHEDTGEIVCKG
ncbi:MAG TPA: YbgC/FadM family acyl-CoA thioesterase, partial [Desulfosarcina sp.]|nr:YbgC/FadM family acyl-CoA thioesterase [Desulfosarcina sp.]